MTPDFWASPLLPADGERIYDSRGAMIPRDPATALDADGEPIF